LVLRPVLDGAQLIDIDVVLSAKDYNDETTFLDKIIVHNSKDILTGKQGEPYQVHISIPSRLVYTYC
jgi:hypothetical protein